MTPAWRQVCTPSLPLFILQGWGREGAGAESRFSESGATCCGETGAWGGGEGRSAYPRCVLTGLGSLGVYCVPFTNTGGDVSEAKVLLKYVDR